MSDDVIAGIDEAGRGAVAGPVVAGACVVHCGLFRRRHAFPCWSPFKKTRDDDCLIADSKLLSPEERERTFAWIERECVWGVGIVGHDVIDEGGIMYANQTAMLLALEELMAKTHVTSLLVDGRDPYRFPLPHQSVIQGDMLHPQIACASIVAKVTRDRLMRAQSLHFPLYGFERHKGYGTAEHLAQIQEHGACPLHRKTFLRAVLENQELPLEIEETMIIDHKL
jgi:ribonuclease HII